MHSHSSDYRDAKTSSGLTSVDPREGESRLHRWKLRLAFALPVLILLAGFIFGALRQDRPTEITIFTGTETGTYHGLGTAMKSLLNGRLRQTTVAVEKTKGSTENQTRAAQDKAALGFVQNNVEGRGDLRTVARLYKEVLQIVVRKGADRPKITDLVGQRISLGPENSGTHELMEAVFAHYGIEPAEYTAVHLNFKQTVASFQQGKIDAAVFLAGLPNDAVSNLFQGDGVEFVSLGPASDRGSILEGLCRGMPGVQPAVIPAHTYGASPSTPVGTVSVDALLVAHRDMSSGLVRDITGLLFENRLQLGSQQAAILEMEELEGSSGLRFPLHPGAASYYARDDPPFFVVYAEPLSLGLTLLLSLGSSLLAFREWRRRARKDRIDTYYLRVEELASGLRRGRFSRDGLRRLRDDLLQLRRQAFRELVAEKLDANEAFTIFQTLVNNRILEVDQALAAALRDPAEAAPPLNPS